MVGMEGRGSDVNGCTSGNNSMFSCSMANINLNPRPNSNPNQSFICYVLTLID